MNAREDDIIIHPQKTRRDRSLPEAGIFIATPGEAKTASETVLLAGGRKHILHHSRLCVDKENSTFVAGPALGAPAAALILEKLIVLGGRRIVFFGWCGGVSPELKVGDIVVPSRAVSGEGTSQYYVDKQEPEISASLRDKLVERLERQRLPFSAGAVWSTDAPYRESRTALANLRRTHNVVGVDMELSAMVAVSAFRGIDIAAVMVVSDELFNDQWRPGFKEPIFRSRCRQVIECLVQKEW